MQHLNMDSRRGSTCLLLLCFICVHATSCTPTPVFNNGVSFILEPWFNGPTLEEAAKEDVMYVTKTDLEDAIQHKTKSLLVSLKSMLTENLEVMTNE